MPTDYLTWLATLPPDACALRIGATNERTSMITHLDCMPPTSIVWYADNGWLEFQGFEQVGRICDFCRQPIPPRT